jgi:hypothetical protein
LVRLGVLTRSGQDVLDGCVVVPLFTLRRTLQALAGLPLAGGPERLVRFGPDALVNVPAWRSSDPLYLVPTLRDVLLAWQRGQRTATCLPGPLSNLEVLEPLLAAWKGSELRLDPSLNVPDTTLQHLASELQVRGVYLRVADTPHPIPAHTLDLQLWQTRFHEYLVARQYSERSRQAMETEVRLFFFSPTCMAKRSRASPTSRQSTWRVTDWRSSTLVTGANA